MAHLPYWCLSSGILRPPPKHIKEGVHFMLKIGPGLSRVLSNLTCLATFVVVIHHTDDILPLTEQVGGVRLVGEYLARVDVPLFFTISGFLLARKIARPGWYGEAIASRFHSLLVPFLLWNLAVALVTALLRPGEFPFSPLGGFCFEVRPVCGASWYLRNLFYFVLLSPLLLPQLRMRWVGLLWLVGFWIAVGGVTLLGSMSWDRLGVVNLAFFLTGAAAACHYSILRRVFFAVYTRLHPLLLVVILGGAWLMVAWLLYHVDSIHGPIYGFVGLRPNPTLGALVLFVGSIGLGMGTLVVVAAAGRWRIPAPIRHATFVVYLLHTELLSVVGRPCLRFLRAYRLPTPLALVLIYVLICTLSLFVASTWRRLLPKAYTLFCGGRG